MSQCGKQEIRHSFVKNLAAFANTNGGKVYVGIEDDFTIQGIKYDMKVHKTEEDIRRTFDEIINKYIGIEHSNLFHLEFMDHTDKSPVLNVTIDKSKTEIWVKIDKYGNKLNSDKEEFFIRGQQGTQTLGPKDYHAWKEKNKLDN